jgi:parallel beta-helix repeat protein
MGAYEYVEPVSCIPRASFTANQTIGTDSLTVEFDASSSGGNQYSGAVFSWDFGDGTSGGGLTTSHAYTDYGSHDVSLTITTECGSHGLTIADLIKIKSSEVTKEVGEGYFYTSIQVAIDDADYGEMILVHDGTYFENINFKGKAITVLSENGVATTIIDGSEDGSVVTFDHCEGTDSVLEGFTLQNGLDDDGSGIFCKSYSSPTITNCIITNNRAYNEGGGIFCRNYSSPTITNCTITNNRAEDGRGGGIYCYNTMPKIINCLLLDNTAEEMPNQICIEYDLATYNDIQILDCTDDNRVHIQRYNQFTGIWRSYYWFFGKPCGLAIPLQGDEFLYISFFP